MPNPSLATLLYKLDCEFCNSICSKYDASITSTSPSPPNPNARGNEYVTPNNLLVLHSRNVICILLNPAPRSFDADRYSERVSAVCNEFCIPSPLESYHTTPEIKDGRSSYLVGSFVGLPVLIPAGVGAAADDDDEEEEEDDLPLLLVSRDGLHG